MCHLDTQLVLCKPLLAWRRERKRWEKKGVSFFQSEGFLKIASVSIPAGIAIRTLPRNSAVLSPVVYALQTSEELGVTV
jgi:hypothetical protein